MCLVHALDAPHTVLPVLGNRAAQREYGKRTERVRSIRPYQAELLEVYPRMLGMRAMKRRRITLAIRKYR